MSRAYSIVLASLAGLLLAAPVARAQVADPVLYSVESPPSDFEYGCFGPCACPILIRGPLTGTFSLRQSHIGPLYTDYDVLNVVWKVPGTTDAIKITGSGTYRRGGEAANMDQLVLDLSFDGGPAQHFDSGLVPTTAAFPAIDKRISLHSEYCHDSVLVVVAKPGGTASAGLELAAPSLVMTPNPFDASTAIGFTLSRDAVIDLAVFDVVGRRVRAVLAGVAMPRGTHVSVWDGRWNDGTNAAPGLYLVRLQSPHGAVTRALSKLH
jgi:hypothetical protein